MFNKININIPEPCHENWEAMSVENKGKFCSSCKKTVFDFTKATDKEIIHHLNKEKNTCGRFLNTQLNRNLLPQNRKSSYWSVIFTSVISFIGIGTQNVLSQTKQETIQTDKKNIIVKDSIQNPNLTHTIKGIVSDQIGPLAGANAIIKGTTNGVTTDFDGVFEIEAQLGDILEITYMGMKTEIITVGVKNNYYINLKEHVLGEVVIVGGLKRRTFFGRQIHKIRNWFR
jgi:hypothetical protein